MGSAVVCIRLSFILSNNYAIPYSVLNTIKNLQSGADTGFRKGGGVKVT